MKIEDILKTCDPSQKTKLILEEHMPAIVSEAELYAGIRFAQFTAYRNAGFTVDQSIEVMKMPRLQA
jgi:hypothetical protein